MSITRINPVYQPVGNYQPAGSYAAANHTHSNYAPTSHTHNTTTTTLISTLSATSSINHLGYYNFGEVGGALLTKWNAAGAANPGDFHAVCMDFNGDSSGCIFGKLIVTSPRSDRLWLVNIWGGNWDYVRQI